MTDRESLSCEQKPPETPEESSRKTAIIWWLTTAAALFLTIFVGFASAIPGWSNWALCTGGLGILALISLFSAIRYSRIASKK